MVNIKTFILLLGLIAASSALLLRSEEHIKRREALMANVDNFAEQFRIQYDNYTKYGIRSTELESMFKMMQLPTIVGRVEIEDFPPEAAIISCLFCRTTMASLLQRYRNGDSRESIMQFAFDSCMQATTFGAAVCQGVVDLNADSLFYIIGERPSLTANQICSVVLQGECGDPDPVFDFTISVSAGPAVTQHKSGSIPRNSNEIKILHFSDPHYDPAYLIGGYANCPEPVCCRRDRGIAADPADRAGRWGDYRDCDSPWEVVEDVIRSARRDHPDASIVYITGDFVDHGVWETTHAGNIAIMDRFYNLVKEVFAGVSVYPVIGNHEAHPTNVFAPIRFTDPALSINWLYEHAATAWATWLPSSALATVRTGGHYTVLHQPGFRIIVLNNNDCYIYNWWVLYSRNEPADQLQWLHNTLLAAEAANEYVHLLYHIPSGGGSCIRFWSREFRRIIDRFHRIISGQFMGHSHRDEFNVFYGRNTDFAINYGWNGGTTTTFSNVNPNYVLYHVDNQIFQVNEADSWYYSITEANLNPNTPPVWRKLFSMRADFGLPDLSPASLHNWLFNTLGRNRATLRRYFEYTISRGDPLMTAPCDDECLRNHLCAIVINEFNEHRICNQLRQLPLA